jgi:hypothetical protein
VINGRISPLWLTRSKEDAPFILWIVRGYAMEGRGRPKRSGASGRLQVLVLLRRQTIACKSTVTLGSSRTGSGVRGLLGLKWDKSL